MIPLVDRISKYDICSSSFLFSQLYFIFGFARPLKHNIISWDSSIIQFFMTRPKGGIGHLTPNDKLWAHTPSSWSRILPPRKRDPLRYKSRRKTTILGFARPIMVTPRLRGGNGHPAPNDKVCSYLPYSDPLGSHLEN